MTRGYIYCFSNPSMNGILKIGMTLRKPCIRLCEANSSDTWRPPTPYSLEFAKYVLHPKEKESALHSLLERYAERIHKRREFFRVTPTEVRAFFDLIDGNMWTENDEEHDENDMEVMSLEEKRTSIVDDDEDEEDEDEEDEEKDEGVEYTVEKILDHKFEGKRKRKSKSLLQLHVKWLGYKETSWEPFRNLRDVDKVHEYLIAHEMSSFIPTEFQELYQQTAHGAAKLRKNPPPKEDREVEMEFDF